jgi:hypothetical protein
MDSFLITLKWISNFIIQLSVGITWVCAAILVLIYSVIFLRGLVHIFNRLIREETPNNYIQTPHLSQMRKLEEEEDWEEVCFKYANAV